MEVDLAAINGKQPPIRKPIVTAPARIMPQGSSIDLQKMKFKLTKLAFWTDNSAITAIHTAAIAETTKLTINFSKKIGIRKFY
jgi:hypothetical protein